ncbi:type IV toxin-antitoxin system AbiEi family antitoxin domain-containing protein [Variovorax guangxiensis]|uniref:type IV toxin-antitoxin system AbiEi family antitoxin domain-containing protein n=1 Tax=Variovorax guangxiensis TaxID=1775474 RepID=UPI00286CA19E|nr:type IV toxin-antitoxin system AbiEi family antitoxin domain-containing protein [Variovorax guangxiensis]
MTTIKRSKLNSLLTQVPSGTPVTSEDLALEGVSADLAVHYVRAGWLKRLARGVYMRPDAALQRDPSLWLLQRQIPGLHVGGKTALDWHGVRHYVSQVPKLQLYGLKSARLPAWFTDYFPAEYHRKQLFSSDATATGMKHVGPFEGRANGPNVSSPERAFLELMSEVGVRQPLAEARELAESAYGLRASVLGELLRECTNVKTVRLGLQLGRELTLPWAKKLDPASLPAGADRPWVSRTNEGLLVLKK